MSESDLVARFRSLAEERLRRLEAGLVAQEQGGGDSGALDDVMREIHTLKGESRMLGLLAVNRVAHRTEDLLQHARRTQALREAGLLELAYGGIDLLNAYLREPLDRISSADEPRAAAHAARISAFLEQRGAPVSSPAPGAAGAAAPVPSAGGEEPRGAPEAAEGPSRGGVVRVTGDVVDDLTRTAGVLGLLHARIERTVQEATLLHALATDALRSALGGFEAPQDAPALARLREATAALGEGMHALREVCFTASLRHQRLRDTVSSLRLAAVAGLFGRFPRTVRDVARELGKEARAEIRGGEVGADQRILDALGDPLVHLVRNAVDHGIEPPGVRESVGKPRHGTLTLSAAHAGRFVEIRVRDDGRGIDPRAVGEAAVRKGLLSEGDVARMSREEIYEQLFRPSFSTKAEVTDLSGRGVGLDVVKRAVERLGGSVHLTSEVGRGTEFVLRVPVTSALVDALVVRVGSAVFGVPAGYVERVWTAAPSDLEPTGTAVTVRLPDGERALVIDLAAFVPAAGAKPPPAADPVPLVLVAEGTRRVALRVGGFLGQRPLVQESLDPFLQGLRGVTGTAVLEDGSLVAILNVVQVLAWAREEHAAAARASPSAAPALPRAVVAEDSELTRSLVVATLRRAGYEVAEAVDGGEALEAMRRAKPALLVTDLEMPGMDGISLIRRVRGEPALADVPVLVFTTRDRPESKREAADAGADAYLVKREFEEEGLLRAVADLRGRRREGAP